MVTADGQHQPIQIVTEGPVTDDGSGGLQNPQYVILEDGNLTLHMVDEHGRAVETITQEEDIQEELVTMVPQLIQQEQEEGSGEVVITDSTGGVGQREVVITDSTGGVGQGEVVITEEVGQREVVITDSTGGVQGQVVITGEVGQGEVLITDSTGGVGQGQVVLTDSTEGVGQGEVVITDSNEAIGQGEVVITDSTEGLGSGEVVTVTLEQSAETDVVQEAMIEATLVEEEEVTEN